MNVFLLACVVWVACGIAGWLSAVYRFHAHSFGDAVMIVPAMLGGPISLALFFLGCLQDWLQDRRHRKHP